MLRVSRLWRYVIHSPKGINFRISPEDALKLIKHKYKKYFFGAELNYLELKTPSKEFLPFYFCSGHLHAIFTASYVVEGNVAYINNPAMPQQIPQQYVTSPHEFNSVFNENLTQLYAGYKYNMYHVHRALRSENNVNLTRKMTTIDTTNATINLFEQSTRTMKEMLESEVRNQAQQTLTAHIKKFAPDVENVNITFSEFDIKIEDVTPVFMPCYVVKAQYDTQEYTMYVSGYEGTMSGPYLPNALRVARTASLANILIALAISTNKVAGLIYGLMTCLPLYYLSFYIAKKYPIFIRNRHRRRRMAMRHLHVQEDRSGFRPEYNSQTMREEYHRSSYWDSHAYAQRKSNAYSQYAYNNTNTGAHEQQHQQQQQQQQQYTFSTSSHVKRDVKGYYKMMELHGDESINEIRSAFRRQVLKIHPDTGGSQEEMKKLNEAYRILRDPQRRAAYDQL